MTTKKRKKLKWINNGTNNKRVLEKDIDDFINNGWLLGQLPTTTGYVWVNKDGKNTTINRDKLEYYLSIGYNKGKIPSPNEINVAIVNKDGITKRIKKCDLDEYLDNGWDKGNNSLKNFRWINNLKEEKWTDECLEDGWFLGRLLKNPHELTYVHNNDESIQIEKYLVSTYLANGYKKGIGRKNGFCEGSTKNTVWVNKDGITKLIKEDKLDDYLNSGYTKGHLFLKNRCYVNKDGKVLVIDKCNLNYYLSIGYKKGNGLKNSFNKKLIQKDGLRIYVHKDCVANYLKDGWTLGGYGGAVLGKISIYKDNKSIYIDESDLKQYLDNGWHCGRKQNDRKFYITNGTETKLVSLDEYALNYKNCLDWNICISSSAIESVFIDILKNNEIQYKKEYYINDNGKKYFYDFKINNILVELNPTPTHNVTWNPYNMKLDKDYHYLKSKTALENGYRCICMWDWDNIDILLTLLKERKKVYARKCEIKKVDIKIAKNFLNENHFQGYAKDLVRYGLYYDDELVSIMTFGKPRYNKNYEWELIRYCSSENVIGGAEKLFSHFLKDYKPKSIISYCDLSKFTGNLYKKLGFEYKSMSIGKHWYNMKEKMHITDNLLRQRGFDKLLGKKFGIFGKGTSNEELMLEHDFLEVYDCGQAVYGLFL